MKKALVILVFLLIPQFTLAAGLTQTQISSIVGLLTAFGVDKETVFNVKYILEAGNAPSDNSLPSGGSYVPVEAPDSPGISPSTVDMPKEVLPPSCTLNLRWTGNQSPEGMRGLEVQWTSQNAVRMEGINGQGLKVFGGTMVVGENTNGRTSVYKSASFFNEGGERVICEASLGV